MPTYEYRCDECGHKFEEIQKISEPALTKCLSCGKDKVKRLVAAAAFHLKGGGWYKTDYGSSSPSGSGNSGGDSKLGDAAPSASSSTESSAGNSDSGSKPDGGETKAPASHGCGSGCGCSKG
jgi:putative FmdB family regulatory protein